ncbi:MAG TPA: response regulator transcription factor [Gemmatimonadaceae bacterium]|jgi:DNA-binding NarL/FixJ family response regulator|nr:response regulator transcription factor [Gemmatimonadaceae bacterium]
MTHLSHHPGSLGHSRIENAISDEVIRVVLADDHAVVRAGLKAVLRGAQDIQVVGEASDGRELVALVDRLRPTVVVTDLSMGDADGLTATRDIVARGFPTRVLVLTMHAEEEYLLPLMDAGAAGYVVKTTADRELVDAIRTVAKGEVYVQPAAVRVLAKRFVAKQQHPRHAEQARFDQLTMREQSVFRMTAQGYSAPEIGAALCISPKTVDTYKQRMHDKLGLSHRAEYIQLALRLGLLTTA